MKNSAVKCEPVDLCESAPRIMEWAALYKTQIVSKEVNIDSPLSHWKGITVHLEEDVVK